MDGLAPHDFDAGTSPAISRPRSGSNPSYGVRGLLYEHLDVRVTDPRGRPATFTFPGSRSATSTRTVKDGTAGYINLRYTGVTNLIDPLVVDSTDTYGRLRTASDVERAGLSVTHDDRLGDSIFRSVRCQRNAVLRRIGRHVCRHRDGCQDGRNGEPLLGSHAQGQLAPARVGPAARHPHAMADRRIAHPLRAVCTQTMPHVRGRQPTAAKPVSRIIPARRSGAGKSPIVRAR